MIYPNITRKRKILESFFSILFGFFLIFFSIIITPDITILTFLLGIIFIIGGILWLRAKTSAEMRKELATNHIKFCDTLLKNDPNNVKALIDKGLSFKLLEQYENAVECFNEALKIEPANPEALKNKENVINILKKT